MLTTIRWKIGLLMFLGIMINYLDRVNISSSIIIITKGFNLSQVQKGWVLSAFAIGYVLMMVVGGYAVFKFGPRVALTVSALLLALTTVCCGLSVGFISLLVFRFLIGVFEAPIYPAFASIAGTWFPKRERVKAIGLFDIGSYVGIAFATLVIPLLLTNFNWRISFIASGVFTLLWVAAWFFYFRDKPAAHPNISKRELSVIGTSEQQNLQKVSWLKYLRSNKVIGISIGFFCFNYLKSFYLTWLPTYMVQVKGIKLLSFGFVGSLPIIFAVAGEIGTAHLIDTLVAKGYSPTRVKKLPICIGMMLSTIIIFSLFTTNVIAIVTLLTLSYIFLVSASAGIWSIPGELAKAKNEIAIIGSIQNTFSNVAGIVAPIVTGYIYGKTNSFFIPFVISIAISLLGAISYWNIAGELSIIKFGKDTEGPA
jgi:ACS family glucarate transporter-like MFS transporter